MDKNRNTTPPAGEITAADLKTLLAAPDKDSVQLLDVRGSLERLFGTIKPSAHMPLDALEKPDAAAQLTKLGLNPTKHTVVFCASGLRSLIALETLREKHGFTRAQSLRGGLRAWNSA